MIIFYYIYSGSTGVLPSIQAQTAQTHHNNNNNGGQPPSNYVCHKCNIPGHWIQNCPTSNNNGSNQLQNMVDLGILLGANNINRVNNNHNNNNNNNNRGNKPPPNYVCHKCDQKGHWIHNWYVILYPLIIIIIII